MRGFNDVLVECGISFLAVPNLARPLRKRFPHSLNGAPLLIHAVRIIGSTDASSNLNIPREHHDAS
jgi:hypothetical protein